MNFNLLFLYILISIFWLILSQICARFVTGSLLNKIKSTLKELVKKEELKPNSLDDDLSNLKIIEEKKKSLSFITIIIGIIEFIIFCLISIFIILKNLNNFLDMPVPFVQVLGGWLAIKTIGNYNQWSSPILGRAYFYTFFIGTMVNIIFATILGFGWVLII